MVRVRSGSRMMIATLVVCICCMVLMSPMLHADAPAYDPALINPFDRLFLYPYSEGLSIASDITHYLSLVTPGVFAFAAPTSDWLEISVLYATSGVLSFGMRTLLKQVITRSRPYAYDDAYPTYRTAELEDEIDDSFPSGHTIMAFNGAAFTQALFLLRYPDSPYRRVGTIAAWSLAGATAILRVASGNHFATDVLAGAAIGSFFGFAVPYMAWKLLPSWKHQHISVAIGPASAFVQVQY